LTHVLTVEFEAYGSRHAGSVVLTKLLCDDGTASTVETIHNKAAPALKPSASFFVIFPLSSVKKFFSDFLSFGINFFLSRDICEN